MALSIPIFTLFSSFWISLLTIARIIKTLIVVTTSVLIIGSEIVTSAVPSGTNACIVMNIPAFSAYPTKVIPGCKKAIKLVATIFEAGRTPIFEAQVPKAPAATAPQRTRLPIWRFSSVQTRLWSS